GHLVGGQELEGDLWIGPAGHGQHARRHLVGRSSEDGLEGLGEDVAADVPGLAQGAVDAPEDQKSPPRAALPVALIPGVEGFSCGARSRVAHYRLASSARWAAAVPP